MMLFKAMATTEGLARQLAPDINPVEAARPYVMDPDQGALQARHDCVRPCCPGRLYLRNARQGSGRSARGVNQRMS
jgi:hypothetical protein